MKQWSPTEDELLIQLHPSTSTVDLAGRLGRTKASVAHRVSRLGVKFTADDYWLKKASPPRIRPSLWTQAELGYIAGYIDADGSIGVYSTLYNSGSMRMVPSFVAQVQISSTVLPVLQWFADKLAVRPVTGKARWSHDGAVYMIHLNRTHDVLGLLEAIRPYLKTKAPEAGLAIELCRVKLQRRRRGDIAALEEIAGRFKQIKHSRSRGNSHVRAGQALLGGAP